MYQVLGVLQGTRQSWSLPWCSSASPGYRPLQGNKCCREGQNRVPGLHREGISHSEQVAQGNLPRGRRPCKSYIMRIMKETLQFILSNSCNNEEIESQRSKVKPQVYKSWYGEDQPNSGFFSSPCYSVPEVDVLVEFSCFFYDPMDVGNLTLDYAKAFDCVGHNKLWKVLKEMGIPDHLTCLLRNLYADQEATIRTRPKTTDWFHHAKCQSG